jgi:hypothetical protein
MFGGCDTDNTADLMGRLSSPPEAMDTIVDQGWSEEGAPSAGESAHGGSSAGREFQSDPDEAGTLDRGEHSRLVLGGVSQTGTSGAGVRGDGCALWGDLATHFAGIRAPD